MNNKGYSFLEMIVVLALSSILAYSVFFVPTELYEEHFTYTSFSDSIVDSYQLRNAISKDIDKGEIEYVSSNELFIGDVKYEFGDNHVKRNGIKMTMGKYSYELESNSLLKIFTDEYEVKYSVKSSFVGSDDSE